MAEIIDNDGPFYGPEDCQKFEIADHGAPERIDMLPKTVCLRGVDGAEVWYERKSTIDTLIKCGYIKGERE